MSLQLSTTGRPRAGEERALRIVNADVLEGNELELVAEFVPCKRQSGLLLRPSEFSNGDDSMRRSVMHWRILLNRLDQPTSGDAA